METSKEQPTSLSKSTALVTNQNIADAKVHNSKDIAKVLSFFHYTTGSTLDCAIATGILRNSITWYVAELVAAGMLFVVCIGKDCTTKRMVQFYSTNPTGKEDTHE